nr:retrovirus-related Pol polyprotein from transposon TNT 1-94 [Tanacetum cinerariifolium]
MLADFTLPTMVSITNPYNKTPYELPSGKVPNIRHLKPFRCQVTIINTSDHLGKFEGKANDGFLVGYAAHSKVYRVYNLSSKKVEETLNLRHLEDKPNVQGLGQEWYFDLDYLIDSLGYTRFKTNPPAGIHDTNIIAGTQDDDSESECDEHVILVPSFPSNSFLGPKYGFEVSNKTAVMLLQADIETHRNLVLAAGDPAGSIVSTGGILAGRIPAGSVPASHVPAGSVPASHVPASHVPASHVPASHVPAGSVLASHVLAGSVPASSIPDGGVLAGSINSAGFGDPVASESVLAVFTTDHVVVSPLPLGHSLGSSEHSTRFPSPSDLGNHQPTAGIFSSSFYDDDFCADVTNLAS